MTPGPVPQPDRARLRELAYTYAHAPARDTKDVAGNRFYAALDTLLDRLDEVEAENERLREHHAIPKAP